MTVDRESLKALRAAAEAATPGSWEPTNHGYGHFGVQSDKGAYKASVVHAHTGGDGYGNGSSRADATYIALANPAAIIELIDAYERLELEARLICEHGFRAEHPFQYCGFTPDHVFVLWPGAALSQAKIESDDPSR